MQVKLHVGADATSNNQITMNLRSMSAKGLGINGLKIDGTDDTNALDAIEKIKAAITKVSAQRSDLGAVQNRLEHTFVFVLISVSLLLTLFISSCFQIILGIISIFLSKFRYFLI